MDAPSNIHSATGEIKTKIPGITFGPTFEKLAKLNDKFSIVRSFTTQSAAHDSKPIVSKEYSSGAQIGAHYAKVAGASHPQFGMPRNVWLHPQAVDAGATDPIMKLGKFDVTGPLGPAYEPFQPSGKSDLRRDMQLTIDPDRLGDRRTLLTSLNQFRRTVESGKVTGGLDKFQSQALETLTGGISDAFDITIEEASVIDAYDTSKLIDVSRISKRWNNHQRYANHVKNLGKLLLLARRLAERGAGFITVSTDFVWDMHADNNNATMTEGMEYVGRPFDHGGKRIHRGRRGSRTAGKDPAGMLWRNGSFTKDQWKRRSRPLGRFGSFVALRRRTEHGASCGIFHKGRRRTRLRPGHNPEPLRHHNGNHSRRWSGSSHTGNSGRSVTSHPWSLANKPIDLGQFQYSGHLFRQIGDGFFQYRKTKHITLVPQDP